MSKYKLCLIENVAIECHTKITVWLTFTAKEHEQLIDLSIQFKFIPRNTYQTNYRAESVTSVRVLSLFALSSKPVRPIDPSKKWQDSVKHNRTITIIQGEIHHEITNDILKDVQYDEGDTKRGYMEDFFLDEGSQLEKRIAIGVNEL